MRRRWEAPVGFQLEWRRRMRFGSTAGECTLENGEWRRERALLAVAVPATGANGEVLEREQWMTGC
jgi:hypothetical protein